MSDHRPECLRVSPVASRYPLPCICDRLRAAEERGRVIQAGVESAISQNAAYLRAYERPSHHVQGCTCTPCQKEWPT